MRFLSLFQERRKDIVAYRGAIFNQKGKPMIHWIKGFFFAKYQGPYSRDEKVKP